jgi:Pro-kumamolisin, activation domain
MNGKRSMAAIAILTTAGLLTSLRFARAAAQGSTRQVATVAIAGNHPDVALTGWSRAAGDLELHMTAVLALRNRRELADLKVQLQRPGSPNYHKWLRTAEFMRRFGPTQRQMDDLTNWLGANHFTIDKADLATRTVRFSGTVTEAEGAFSTEIVSNPGRYANVSDPLVPKRLAGTIAAIFGLSRLPADQHMREAALKSAGSASTNLPHLTPQDFWYYYDQTSPIAAGNNGGTGAGDCIGLLEDDGILPVEIDTFDAQFGLPAANLTMVPTDDSLPIPYSDTAQECELDVEWAHAVAPNTPIVLYVVTNSGQGAFDALSLAVTRNTCGTISSSIHTCANEAEIKAYFTLEAQAVVQGQTLFHASGDFGSFFACGQPAKYQRTTNVQPSIDETASSPDVTVVGGTQFSPVWGSDGANTSRLAPKFEHVWNVYATVTATPAATPTPPADACDKEAVPTYGCKGGSGGGISVLTYNTKPPWQDGLTAYGIAPADFTRRGVPDVASVANGYEPGLWISSCIPDTKSCAETPPFAIKQTGTCPSGQHLCFDKGGGTSAGAPVWAGISRLLAQNMCDTRLGNINPQLYALAAAGSDALVDVSERGQNCPQAGLDCTIFPGYQVGPGYDLATGLGSADIGKLVAAFSPPAPTVSVTSSNSKSSGSKGQTIDGGTMRLINTGSQPETVGTVTLNVSNPALFSFLSLSASVEGGADQAAAAGPLGATVTFVFAPALTVPAGDSAVFTLSAGMSGASQVAGNLGRPGSTKSNGGGRGSEELAAVLGLIGLGLVLVPVDNRRRVRLFSLMFLLIAATQVGCGSDNNGVIGTSVQSVSACGIGVSIPGVGDATGAAGVTGLPATLSQIRLVD